MADKKDNWTLSRIEDTVKKAPGLLSRLKTAIFDPPPAPTTDLDKLAAQTKTETDKVEQLQKVLEAKKALEDARKKRRELEKAIAAVGQPEAPPETPKVKEPVLPTKPSTSSTRRM